MVLFGFVGLCCQRIDDHFVDVTDIIEEGNGLKQAENITAQNESDNFALWVEEAEKRLADLRAGMAREYPADELFRNMRDALSSTEAGQNR